MKRIPLISLLIFALLAEARILTVTPDMNSVGPLSDPDILDIDTLRILPRGETPLTIEEYTFWNSPNLKTIELTRDCRLIIEEGAFRGCSSLEAAFLPDRAILKGQYIFSGCSSLREVRLPSDLQLIPPHSFSYCYSLSSIILPESLKRIGNNSFSECRSLGAIYLPDSIRELESYAFSECSAMKEARLPANGALLGELLFSGCRNLERIYELSSEIPEFDCNSFIFEPDETDLYSKCRLIVPEAKVYVYRSAPGWSMFRNIIPQPEP